MNYIESDWKELEDELAKFEVLIQVVSKIILFDFHYICLLCL
jgi:hypothetical protein